MRLRPLTTAAASLALALVAPTAADAARLPTYGASDGVTATVAGQQATLRLTGAAAAAARYVGRRLAMECTKQAAPGLIFVEEDGSDSSEREATVERAADGALTLTTELDLAGAWDTCEVFRPTVHHPEVHRGAFQVVQGDERPALALAPLTAAGAAWIDELGRAIAMDDALDAARHIRPSTVLTAAEAQAAGMVVLADESASPPSGSVGYWTDGREKVEVVATSAAGRRLLRESLGGTMARTNVDRYAFLVAAARDLPTLYVDTKHADHDRTPSPIRDRRLSLRPRAALSGTRLTMRFTGRTARATLRRLAGRRVTVACGPAAPPTDVVDVDDLTDVFQLVTTRVPRTGTVLTATLRAGRPADFCAVADDGYAIGTALPTAAGRVFGQDVAAVVDLLGQSLAKAGATVYPGAATVAAGKPGQLVALSGPLAAPPAPGRAGVWTEGAQAVLVTRSRSGHHLVMADEGNGVLRENTSWLLTGGLLLSFV